MDIRSVYKPLNPNVFTLGKIERKVLAENFLIHFLESKVEGNKKKEVEENLNSYTQFTANERKVFKRKPNSTKSKKLTAKEKRRLKVFEIVKDQKFENFFSLHDLWEQYMKQLLNLKPGVKAEPRLWVKQLQSADYHGALVTVIKSKNHSFVGKTGIIIQETRNTFKIVTPKNVVLTIPKADCVFAFELEDFVFTLYGNYLIQRSAARSGKKFKSKGANPMMMLDF